MVVTGEQPGLISNRRAASQARPAPGIINRQIEFRQKESFFSVLHFSTSAALKIKGKNSTLLLEKVEREREGGGREEGMRGRKGRKDRQSEFEGEENEVGREKRERIKRGRVGREG